MKVTALQGDTLDQLCHRYYGKTKGVTEEVLTANPGLSGQVFLNAGQMVEMPDIDSVPGGKVLVANERGEPVLADIIAAEKSA